MSIHDKVKALAAKKAPAQAKPAIQAPVAPPVDAALIAQQQAKMADLERARAMEQVQYQERIAKLEADQRARDAELQRSKVREAVRSAARKAGAIDEDDAADLFLARVQPKLDKDRIVFADKPDATVDSYVAEVLAAKPHLLKPKTPQGGGASPFPAVPSTQSGAPDLETDVGRTTFARSLTLSKSASPAQ